jgi:hypothetical protein
MRAHTCCAQAAAAPSSKSLRAKLSIAGRRNVQAAMSQRSIAGAWMCCTGYLGAAETRRRAMLNLNCPA